MTKPAISLHGAGKRFTKYEDTPTLVYGLAQAWRRTKRGQLWALRDVDLEIQPGEAVGVIGRNGQGKSTLLQLLCGVTAPTTGTVHVRGRVAPLISVGVGFHPELTGRENIYVNGTILGLTRAELDRRLDEIVAFSEIEQFLDTPVKFYSSGMFVRLGFSVAAHINPDVLLIDEVLAVGDLGFQLKCFRHMQRLLADGTTIVVVSHNLNAIRQVCPRALLISEGRKIVDGPVEQTVSAFHEAMELSGEGTTHTAGGLRVEHGVLSVLDVRVSGETGTTTASFRTGERLRVDVRVRANARISAPYLSFTLLSESGVVAYQDQNLFEPYPSLEQGEERVLSAQYRLDLATGSYALHVVVGRGTADCDDPLQLADDMVILARPPAAALYVDGRASVTGVADLHADFSYHDVNAADQAPGQPAPPIAPHPQARA